MSTPRKIPAGVVRIRARDAKRRAEGYQVTPIKEQKMSKTSANGKGRTVWEIIMGRNIKDMTPLELQYHNPLQAVVGVSVSFAHDINLSGINFFLEAIDVYETKVGKKKFYFTDYLLKGVTLSEKKPVRLRLRITPDSDVETGFRYQIYKRYFEMEWDQSFHDDVLNSGSGIFEVNQDDDGNELEQPLSYSRIGNVTDPYQARKTGMKDENNSGSIDDDELEHSKVTYWDYSRETTNPETEQKFMEYLDIEMDDKTKYFTFYRGTDILAYQITVV